MMNDTQVYYRKTCHKPSIGEYFTITIGGDYYPNIVVETEKNARGVVTKFQSKQVDDEGNTREFRDGGTQPWNLRRNGNGPRASLVVK